MDFLEIFIISYIGIFLFYLLGNLICSSIETVSNFANYSLISIYGFITTSLITLIINFILPVNNFVCNAIFFIGIVIGIYIFLKKKFKIDLLIYFFIISLITLILISYSNINRPDAGLYHIPYIQTLHENKILIGLANLHFRFGHASIIQYSSSIFNNSLFPKEALNLPLAIIVSIFFIYLISYFKNINNNKELKIFVFFITLYSFYSFNRYSNFGNDATSHLFFFLFIIKFLEINFKKINSDQFGNLILISAFAYLQKPFMALLFIMIFIIFFIIVKKIHLNFIFNKKIIISILLIFFWTLKNFLISGCAIYPLKYTCLTGLSYVNEKNINEISIRSEAWAKDWPNYENNKKISQKEYLNFFIWFKVWKNNHLNKIIEKFMPFTVFSLFLTIVSLFFFRKKKENKSNKFLKIKIIIIVSILFSFIWFIKFPLYRYGQSFLAVLFISIASYIFVKFIDLKKINKLLVSLLFFLLFFVLLKNFQRIYYKKDLRNIYPNIYTLSEFKEDNYKKKLETILVKNDFKYFYSKTECMYNDGSPCSNYKNNVFIDEIFGYKIISFANDN